MDLQHLRPSRLKTSPTVLQRININLQKHPVNIPASLPEKKPHRYTRQKTLQNPKKPSNPASTRNNDSLPQIRRKTRYQASAEPAYLTSLNPSEHYPSPSLSTTQNVVDRTELLRHYNRQDVITKPVKVLSTVLAPTPKNSTSESVQDRGRNHIEPSATVYTPTPFVLPDPGKPPADQDNTSIWEAVMSKKAKAARSKAEAPPTVAGSAGAKGTSGFELFLVKLLGVELDDRTKYTSDGPDSHFGREQGTLPVAKYVETYSGEEAYEFADAMLYFTLSKHSESDLCDYLKEKIFRSGVSLEPRILPRHKMPFDQKAIVRRTEYNSRFQSYNVSELRRGLADIRHIRLSPKERLEGHSTVDTPNLLPAETDLRGRCDMAFGIDEKCLEFLLQECADSYVPCHDPSAGICSIWLRAEFKKADDKSLIKAARHQWAVGAYLELQSRVRLARDKKSGSYLSDSCSTNELRQYGYIVCGAHVEIWEMYVAYSGSTQEGNRRETNYYESCFLFPARKLAGLNLDTPKGVEQFCRWHTKIMDWGFNVYSRQYLDNVDYLLRSGLPSEDWALSYEYAIGREIPPFPDEEQENTNPIDVQVGVVLDPSSHLKGTTGAEGLSAQGMNTQTAAASDSLNLPNVHVGATMSGEQANTSLKPRMVTRPIATESTRKAKRGGYQVETRAAKRSKRTPN